MQEEMIPVFGERLDIEPKEREAAYAVILRDDRIAVVYDSHGSCFLPGGGVRPGETAEVAVLREIREECGAIAEIKSSVGEAIQFFTSSKGEYYRMHVSFFTCFFKTEPSLAGEHLLAWENPGDVQFLHECHQWVVNRVLGRA